MFVHSVPDVSIIERRRVLIVELLPEILPHRILLVRVAILPGVNELAHQSQPSRIQIGTREGIASHPMEPGGRYEVIQIHIQAIRAATVHRITVVEIQILRCRADLPGELRAALSRADDAMEIAEGGAATVAYSRLQFEDLDPAVRDSIERALLKYCELDTLAMVMVYEAWREWLSS